MAVCFFVSGVGGFGLVSYVLYLRAGTGAPPLHAPFFCVFCAFCGYYILHLTSHRSPLTYIRQRFQRSSGISSRNVSWSL